MKIFISATTSEFQACRDALASDLRAVGAAEVKVQEDFRAGPRTLLEKLEAYVEACDRVIMLVGDYFGAEPTTAETPAGSPRRSYTQWEYFFAIGERLDGQRAKRKDVFVYFASPDFPRADTAIQDDVAAKLQEAFIETILLAGEDRQVFSSLAELRALVLRDGFRLPQFLIKPCNLPYASLGKLFKGRDDFLSELHNRILNRLDADCRAKPVAITQTPRQAICGLGGIGKTRLAVEYALRYIEDYSALLFVVGESPEHLRKGVADLALVLDLKEAASKQDEEARFMAALRWLMEHPGWCLIIDNVDDEKTAIECENLISKLYGGHVIITSRLNQWSMSGIEELDLDVLDNVSARDLLLERTPKRFKTEKDEEAAEELAMMLDGLALGLEQAGAYINSEQCSIVEYLGLWKNGEAEVTEWFKPQIMKYPKSVAMTWNATVNSIGPAAEAVLRLLSCFAASPIPARIFTCQEVQKTMMRFLHGTDSQREKLSPRSLLTKLASFSMLKKLTSGSEQCLILHRVVHDITWRRIPEEQRTALLETAAELFVAVAPHEADRFENWAAWRVLLPHAESLWKGMQPPYPRENWNIRLLHGLALYYLGQHRHAEGEMLQRYTYELMAQRNGENKPETLQAKNDLALLLDDRKETLRLLREALEGFEQLPEIDRNPETEIMLLECAYNVALFLSGEADGEKEAESFLRRCVAGFTASPEAGVGHWRTLMTNRQLAYLLWRTGRQQEAEELAKKTLKLAESSPKLGPNHKDTLDSVAQVAEFLVEMTRFEDAEPFLRRALIGREKALGPQHANTLLSFNFLLYALHALRRPNDVEELCDSRRRQWQEAIGAEHPNTVACTRELVKALALNRKISDARRVEVELNLALIRRQYYDLQARDGGENQALLQSLLGLADSLRECGHLKEAESAYRRLLDGLRHEKCEDDENVAIGLNNYGLLLRDAGRLDDSLKCYQEALAIDEKLRTRKDPKHPKIPHRLNNISMVLLMLGKTDEAKAHLARAWSLKESNHDVTSARILWVRLAAAMITDEQSGMFLGQLKTALDMRESRISMEVGDYWNVESVLDHFRKTVSTEHGQLLATLVDAFNAGSRYGLEPACTTTAKVGNSQSINLDDLDMWKGQEPVPLESPWQN